jgi:hypothetical protein
VVVLNQDGVSEATGGRIAYIHVPDTYLDGIREFTKQFFPQVDREGIIVDERFNSGGWPPDFFVERLARKTWVYWAVRDAADDRTFAVQVAFCRTLEPEQRLALFERRKTELSRRLTERTREGGARSDAYRRSLREHDTKTITHDLAWIDELIGAARAELAASAVAPSDELAHGSDEPHLTGGTHP